MPVIDSERRLQHLRWILCARLLENRIRVLYRQGHIPGGAYLGTGQEGVAAAVGMHLRPGDIYAPLIRDMAGRLAFGEEMVEALRVYTGRQTSHMQGRDGNVHRGLIDAGHVPMISHLGSSFGIVDGLTWARRQQGHEAVGVISIGDGGINTGAASEGLNHIAVHRSPVVVVVANNHYAYSTPNRQSFAVDLCARGRGFGLTTHACSGVDADDCLQTIGGAIAAARSGAGPQFVVAELLRLAGHGEHDDAAYVSEDRTDPAYDIHAQAQAAALEAGLIDATGLRAWEAEIEAEIEAAVTTVLAEPSATAAQETWQAYADDVLSGGPAS